MFSGFGDLFIFLRVFLQIHPFSVQICLISTQGKGFPLPRGRGPPFVAVLRYHIQMENASIFFAIRKNLACVVETALH